MAERGQRAKLLRQCRTQGQLILARLQHHLNLLGVQLMSRAVENRCRVRAVGNQMYVKLRRAGHLTSTSTVRQRRYALQSDMLPAQPIERPVNDSHPSLSE